MLTVFDIRSTRRHKELFKSYNQKRINLAYALNSEKASVAFEIIPALLSVNVPGLPGYVAGGDAVCGICRTGTARDFKKVLKNYFPEIVTGQKGFRRFLIQRPVIESLLLIGSIGTVAQTANSDFDYWVCFDNKLVSPKAVGVLQDKAAQIEHWCQDQLDMEVHFFVSDIDHIRLNDFGQVDEESTGSSQRKLLKEECYRTLLVVAGKIPFWWVVQPGIDESQYHFQWQELSKQAAHDLVDYVDLGFIADIDREEFLGATLWQLSKSLKDPFKALIKMSVLKRYLSADFAKSLLCDEVKKMVFGNSAELQNVDPYLVVIKTVLGFYEDRDEDVNMELLRRALYLKSAPNVTRMRIKLARGDYKIEVFKSLMAKWDWSLEKFEYLNQVKAWGYARRLQFAQKINDFFFDTYARLRATQFDGDKQAIAEDDLRRLKQELNIYFARKTNKMQLTPLLASRHKTLKRCIFRLGQAATGKHEWFLFDATRYSFEPKSDPAKIFVADRLVRIAAWVIVNGLFDYHKTTIEMPPNPIGINVNDLIELHKHLQSFFEPAAGQIKYGASFEQKPRQERVMVVADIEKDNTRVLSKQILDLVYKNTWGEMYVETYDFYSGLRVLQKYIAGMSVENGQVSTNKIKIHLPKHKQTWEGAKMIRNAILQGLKN
jgi:adenylate cyclase, class 1